MKREDVLKTEGPIKKVTGFQYHPGSISGFGPEESPKEQRDERVSRAKKHLCVRCGKPLPEEDESKFCGNCGEPVAFSKDYGKEV